MVENETIYRKNNKLIRWQRYIKAYGRECAEKLGIANFDSSNSRFYAGKDHSNPNHCMKNASIKKPMHVEEYLLKRNLFINEEYMFYSSCNLLDRNGNVIKQEYLIMLMLH